MLSEAPVTLFIFAHQDDEIAFFLEIESTLKQGRKAVCVYLTNGEWKDVKSETRNKESKRTLMRLGVKERDIFFLGDKTKIKSGELPQNALKASRQLSTLFEELRYVESIVTFAYEGGHEDHDATFWIALHLAQHHHLTNSSRCVPFYRASDSKWLPFTAFKPLSSNGNPQQLKISWRDRLRYVYLCFSYPSQTKTFLGLSPFILLQYLLRGRQLLQPMLPDRAQEKPNNKILYEQRNRYQYLEFRKYMEQQLPLKTS